MAWLRSVLFALVFYPGSAVAAVLALPAGAGGPEVVRRHVLRWARFHRWCARTLLGIESRVEGEPPTVPMLVAAKHQSMFETVELLLLLSEPAIVAKRELADIPVWGRIARMYGVIPVERTGSAAALRTMLRAAREALRKGRPILIFPEGTRVAPGERPPLRPGFAGLYRALDLPVAPIALDSGRLWPRGFVKRSGIITIRFGPAIPAGLPRREIEARVEAAINTLEP